MIKLDKTIYTILEMEDIPIEEIYPTGIFNEKFHCYHYLGILKSGQSSSLLYIKLPSDDQRHIKTISKKHSDTDVYEYLRSFIDICCIIEILKEEIKKNGLVYISNNKDKLITLFSFSDVQALVKRLSESKIQVSLNESKYSESSRMFIFDTNMKMGPVFCTNYNNYADGKSFIQNIKSIKNENIKPNKKLIAEIINLSLKGSSPGLTECGDLLRQAYNIKEALMIRDYRFCTYNGLSFYQKIAQYFVSHFSNEIIQLKTEYDNKKIKKDGRPSTSEKTLKYGKMCWEIKTHWESKGESDYNAKAIALTETVAAMKEEYIATEDRIKTERLSKTEGKKLLMENKVVGKSSIGKYFNEYEKAINKKERIKLSRIDTIRSMYDQPITESKEANTGESIFGWQLKSMENKLVSISDMEPDILEFHYDYDND